MGCTWFCVGAAAEWTIYMANMRDVSEESGVSLASVSRILAEDPNFQVRDETRQRVLDVARKLGYRNSARARTGAKVGCLLSFTAEAYSDKYFMTILSAVNRDLQNAGCSLSPMYAAGDITKIEKMLKAEALSGLILFDDTLPEHDFERLRTAVPCIVGVDTDYQGVDNVGHDEFRTGILAVKHLIARGHTRIAYIGGDERSLHSRRYAYLNIINQHGLSIPPDYLMDCGWDPDKCHDLILKLCSDENRPTAIFAGSDNLAIAVLSAIHELGMETPGDVAVVGVNDLDFTAFTSPTLTTVSIPMEEIGSAAAELLLRRINGYTGIPIRMLFPTTLIIRQST